MADEEDQILEDDGQETINKTEKRIKDLSEKVKLTAAERDEKDALVKKRDEELASTAKERDFYKSFSAASAKYPAATEYQDKILEKVKAGYDVEDAMVSILNKEGKLQATPPPRENPAGGSATTTVKSSEKTMAEMTQAEKREILEKNLDLT